MKWRWMIAALLVSAVAGKGKKHKHQKPGRAVLDRLASTTISEPVVTSDATSGWLPAPLDAAPFSVVEASAVCGERGVEDYCREMPAKRGVVCGVCEGPDGAAARQHPASHAVDADPATWWQSPTAASMGEDPVSLITTMPAVMELMHVIIKSGPSPRPLAWSLEVSITDSSDDWRLLRAFGDKEHCRKLWDLRPERRRRKARAARGVKRTNRADKPTCSTQFTSPRPLENGEMHVPLGSGVIARRVRISFRAAHSAPQERQYYTVRSLTLAARCLCHGHADYCTVNSEGSECHCLDGTCGRHCDRCCTGGHWMPDQPCDVTSGDVDDTGAIVSVNCTDNRAGPLCDRCPDGFYSVTSDGPCVPCGCHPDGSDGTCMYNTTLRTQSCVCLPHVSGALCDACANPAAIFPQCDVTSALVPATSTAACRCDPRGTLHTDGICDDVCVCKENVIGSLCDTCAVGHFGLSAELAEGCRPCYCSHVTPHCDFDPDEGTAVTLPMGEDLWLVSDQLGNQTLSPSLDDEGKPYLVTYEVEGWDSYYWSTNAPSLLSSYGSYISAALYWSVVRGDTGGNPTLAPDFLLRASDGTTLAYGLRSHETPGQLELRAPLVEGGWRVVGGGAGLREWEGKGEDGARAASRSDVMRVLADLRVLMVRAHFHWDQDEVRLSSVSVPASPGGSRELCACPGGYSGTSCETCAFGHWRLRRGDVTTSSSHASPASAGFECVPCACHNHADCDSAEGPCGPCQHNTTGPHCERCLPGHYGNPVKGGCKPCACPLYVASNNFSPLCALAAADGDDFVCTQCPDGYTGDKCETCDFGYWGDPTTVGGSCSPCACASSSPSSPGSPSTPSTPCDPRTGRCLPCAEHAVGARCHLCEEGFYMDNSTDPATCQPCACAEAGSLSPLCDVTSGQCACRTGWAGRRCAHCGDHHADVSRGCPPCACGAAAVNKSCDVTSGACVCAPGAAPPLCDNCLEEYYGLDANGCLGCNCSSLGSESNVCDIRSGQCRCKPHVTGRACDTCEEGYWGLVATGCRRCACGAGAEACDPVTGGCACARGVTGRNCDTCLPGYYGFGPAGCLPCPHCTDGKVCDAETGRCACPARSMGPRCSQCAKGHWGPAPHCRPCDCGPGSLSQSCDSHSGACECRAGWTGRRCDTCAPGHAGPRCRPCACDAAGTQLCGDMPCPCDPEGNCQCKVNVEGQKCDRCRVGTFGLSEHNPSGCTACFCFGRSSQCTRAGLTRGALRASAPRHLTLRAADDVNVMEQESLLAIHTEAADATIAMPWPPVPVYMELDKRFLGDRLTSYGGALRFTVEEEGGKEMPVDLLQKFPLVRIYGRQDIVLDYYQRTPPINGSHSVRLYESLWSGVTAPLPASRAALMVLLQGVERVLLRVTTRAPSAQDPVHALLLNVSLDTAIPGSSRSARAQGVELCSCPRQYAAASCQRPAAGFWQPPQTYSTELVGGTILIRVEGDVQPCRCNGRATECDAVTGRCLNCTDGTGGARCETCAAGYTGSPREGCRPCPCPHPLHNHATECHQRGGLLQCVCQPGYTGSKCESCAFGYVRSGSECVACACDVTGALTRGCDVRARCQCRGFAAGDKCDQCRDGRSYMGSDGCVACDNCTQTLLDSIEHLASDLHSGADVTELSRLPKPFPALLQFAYNNTELRSKLDSLQSYKDDRLLEREVHDLALRVQKLLEQSERQKARALMDGEAAYSLSLESMTGLEEVLSQRRRIAEQISLLDDFAQGERHLSAHRAMKEATRLLRTIKEVNFIDYIVAANDVFDKAMLQSTSIQEHNYQIDSTAARLRSTQKALADWSLAADDVPRLADKVWDAGDEVAAVGKRVKPKLVAIRDLGLRCRLLLEDVTSEPTSNLTSAARDAVHRASTLALSLPELTSELMTLTAAAEEKEGILYSLTPAYRSKYLTAVHAHVGHLKDKADAYKSLFSGTRSLAAAGMEASRAWAEVTSALQAAAGAASAALARATRANKLARGAKPIIHAAERANKESARLMEKGGGVLKKAGELESWVSTVTRRISRVETALRGLGWQERALSSRPNSDVTSTLAPAAAAADRVYTASRALYDEASEIRRRSRYHLRRQLAELQKHGDTQLGAAQEHVSQILGWRARATEVAGALAAAAAARAQDHAAADRTLRPRADMLRDRLLRARHAAGSISVSLTSRAGSAGGCARAYLVPPSRAAVTRLLVTLSFDRAVRDGTIFHLTSDSEGSYMKLYVHDARLNLVWSLGDDEGRIQYGDNLEPTHDDADHTLYRIEVERIWNTVKLTVERAGGPPSPLVNATSPSRTSLSPARLWVGAARAPLPACVHALYYDDRRLGLWDFVEQPREAECTGCTQRWYSQSRSGDQSLAWFNGAGYSELRRSSFRPSDRRSFSLAFVFRTRDEDALLFMARDTTNNRSVSVSLRACRVVFRVQYASSSLEITAAGPHCHGRAVHVQAIRLFAGNRLEKGSLRVNGEETLGSPEPPVQSATVLPDLDSAAYWVGGTPPGVSGPGPLLGCLGALTVDREGYDPLDTTARQGVEPGCGSRILRSLTAEGSGYIELAAPTLRRKAALGLSFRARKSSGLLLYRPSSAKAADNEVDDDDGDDKHYLAIVLLDGQLEVVISAGKAELRLRTNGTRLDDAKLHSIRLIRAHKQVELYVNSALAVSGSLPGNAIPARSRGLWLAGAADTVVGVDNLPMAGFTGTLADLVVDGNLLGLETAVRWSRVRVGRRDPERSTPARPAPRAPPPAAVTAAGARCTKSSSYTVEPGAVKFGDSAGSHAHLRLRRLGPAPSPGSPLAAASSPAARDLVVQLQLRTFRTEGLILLAPGSKSKPRHYLALLLKEGKLHAIVRGRRRKEVTLQTHVADGTWQTVSIRLSLSRVVLSCGSSAVTGRSPRRVGLAGRLYVGGLPNKDSLPALPDSLSRMSGLVGCVRRVTVSGRTQDLASAPRVRQCFPNVQPGAHFAGDAHAVWSSAWSGTGSGSELSAELRLEFRTTEPDGLLAAAKNFVLELKDGAVIITRRSNTGDEQSRVQSAASTSLCDDRWHAITARVTSAVVTLSVDGGPELRGDSPGLLDDVTESPVLMSPLYIGGLPEGVADGVGGGKENFKGCIRDVTVAGEKKDWTNMESIHNVLIDSCPIPQ